MDSVSIGNDNSMRPRILAWALEFLQWANSLAGRGVLKCSIAYTIATLGALPQPLISFLGKPGGKHVIATITVYFHPARSTGSMIEAVLIASTAVIYAEVVSVLSMATSVLVGAVWGYVALAHIIVVVVFIGGSFGLLGWVKQRMGNPLVDVASTLASLAIITVVTKETAVVEHVFSTAKIVQVLKMLVMGITSTTLVNLLLWRVSARDMVRDSMVRASESLSNMLSGTTTAFIDGFENESDLARVSAAASSYSGIRPQMMKNLREAKFEHLCLGDEQLYTAELAVANSVEALAQGIGGLRSSCSALLAVLHLRSSAQRNAVSGLSTPIIISAFPTPTEEIGEPTFSFPAITEPQACTANDFFRLYMDSVADSTLSLASQMSAVLCESGSTARSVGINGPQASKSLASAITFFNEANSGSLRDLYEHPALRDTSSPQAQVDLEQVAAICGHFASSLQSLAEEILEHIMLLEDLQNAVKEKKKTWLWASPSFRRLAKRTVSEAGLEKSLDVPDAGQDISEMLNRHSYGSVDETRGPTMTTVLSRAILFGLRRLARDDLLFGVKVGIGASLWAALSFLEQTREIYREYSGEWGLLSFMIVCSMTVGASNTTGGSRFTGTLLGAAFSFINWKVSGGNPIALLFLGWLVSYWNFYLIVCGGRPTIGRMTQLAYNVSTLYAYSIKHKDTGEDEMDVQRSEPIIEQIIRHRIISVSLGILWGLIICRIIWPISARGKFQQGVSIICLRMGMVWRRGPLAVLIHKDFSQSFLLSGEHTALQEHANRLDRLRDIAKHEFDLRGAFPCESTSRVIDSIRRILDAFYSMSLISQRSRRLTTGEETLLRFTEQERAMLCDRICHVFHVIASSMMLEYPVMNGAPDIALLQSNLLSKIFQFRNKWQAYKGERRPMAVAEKDYALLYAYALVAGQVAGELQMLERELKVLYGDLDGEHYPLIQRT